MQSRILITGGAGFIGSHTGDLLLKENKKVIILDNLSSGKKENLNLNHPNLEFIEADILDFPHLNELVASCDGILHLAALPSVQLSIENPIHSFKVNTQSTVTILQAISLAKKPIRLVYASSASVYGYAKELPCRDDLPLNRSVLAPYALQKIHTEDYAHLYEKMYGLKSLGLRYFNVYGLRQDPHSIYSGVISRFIDAFINRNELVIFGDGKQSRDFIHVEDVAIANCLALNSNCTGVLNIATGKANTLLELVAILEQTFGSTGSLSFQSAKEGDIKISFADVERAKQFLGFKSTISLSDGIKIMVKNAYFTPSVVNI